MARDFFIAQTLAPFSNDHWSRSTIYDFVNSQRPDAPHFAAIQRLYGTLDHRRTPARLLFTQALEVGADHEVVAYIWDPADDRGHVAIAFPAVMHRASQNSRDTITRTPIFPRQTRPTNAQPADRRANYHPRHATSSYRSPAVARDRWFAPQALKQRF